MSLSLSLSLHFLYTACHPIPGLMVLSGCPVPCSRFLVVFFLSSFSVSLPFHFLPSSRDPLFTCVCSPDALLLALSLLLPNEGNSFLPSLTSNDHNCKQLPSSLDSLFALDFSEKERETPFSPDSLPASHSASCHWHDFRLWNRICR